MKQDSMFNHLFFGEPFVNDSWQNSFAKLVAENRNWQPLCERLIRKKYDQSSKFKDGYSRIACHLMTLAKYQEAKIYYEKDIRLNRASWWQIIQYAQCLVFCRRLRKASQLVAKIYGEVCEARNGYSSIAVALAALGRKKKATVFARKDVAMDRVTPGYLLNVATILMDCGHEKQAAKMVNHAYALRPELRNGYARLALYAYRRADWQNCRMLFEKDIASGKCDDSYLARYADCIVHCAGMLIECKHERRASHLVDKAYSRVPALRNLYSRLALRTNNRVSLTIRRKLFEKDRVLGLCDDFYMARYAVCLALLGNLKEALDVVERIESSEASYSYREIAKHLERTGLFNVAAELRKKAGDSLPLPRGSQKTKRTPVSKVLDPLSYYWPPQYRNLESSRLCAGKLMPLVCVNGNAPQLPQLDLFLQSLRDPDKGNYTGDVCVVTTGMSSPARQYLSRYDVSVHTDPLQWLYKTDLWYVIGAFVSGIWNRSIVEPNHLTPKIKAAFDDYRNKHFSKLALLSAPPKLLNSISHILFFDGDIVFQQPLANLVRALQKNKIAVALEHNGIIRGSPIYKSNCLALGSAIGKYLRNGPHHHEVNVGFIGGEKDNMFNLFRVWKHIMFKTDLKWLFTAHPLHAWHEQDFMRALLCLIPSRFQILPSHLVLHMCNGGSDLAKIDEENVIRLKRNAIPPVVAHFAGGTWRDYLYYLRCYSLHWKDLLRL